MGTLLMVKLQKNNTKRFICPSLNTWFITPEAMELTTAELMELS